MKGKREKKRQEAAKWDQYKDAQRAKYVATPRDEWAGGPWVAQYAEHPWSIRVRLLPPRPPLQQGWSVVCTDADDTLYAVWNQTEEQARRIYSWIQPGVTVGQLKEYGLCSD